MSKVKIGMQHIGKKKKLYIAKKSYFLKKKHEVSSNFNIPFVVIDYLGVDSDSQPQSSLFFQTRKLFFHVFPS